jgi:hypothetical protein
VAQGCGNPTLLEPQPKRGTELKQCSATTATTTTSMSPKQNQSKSEKDPLTTQLPTTQI